MDNAVPLPVLPKLIDIDSLGVIQTTIPLRDANDLVSAFMHQLRSVRAYVTEALDDHARALTLHFKFLKGLVGDDHHATTGRLAPSSRATDVQWLACHHGG